MMIIEVIFPFIVLSKDKNEKLVNPHSPKTILLGIMKMIK